MKISERVSLVGSGKLGMQISHAMDCNVYLLDGGMEYALIDAGSGVEPEKIINRIERLGVAMERIKLLLLTHVHGDHAAGARYFHDVYGIQVITSDEASSWLAMGDMDKTSLLAAQRAGIYPPDFSYPPCPVFRGVLVGNKIKVGDLQLEVINTPGHAKGHISYLFKEDEKNSLFSGDTVFSGGKVVVQNIWDCNIQEYAETVSKLAQLKVEKLYPGHGPFILTQAFQHIIRANDYFKRLQIPPNL